MVTMVDRLLVRIEAQTEKAEKRLRHVEKILLSVGMAFLFTGMALKNFSQKLILDLANAFMNVADVQNTTFQGIRAMQAALISLKFVLFETFASSNFGMGLIELFIRMADFISQIIQKNPELAQMAFIIAGIGFAVGFLMQFTGQILMFSLAFTALGISAGAAWFWILAIVAAVALLSLIWLSDMPLWQKVLLSVIVVLAVLFALWRGFRTMFLAALVKMIAASWAMIAPWLPFLIIIAAIVLIVGLLIWTFMKMKAELGSNRLAWIAMGIAALKVIATIGDALRVIILSPLMGIITLFNSIAGALGLDTIRIPRFMQRDFFGAKVDNFQRRLEAENRQVGSVEQPTASDRMSLDDLSISKIVTGIKEGFGEALDERGQIVSSTEF